jgi:hypothetical protein
MAKVAVCGSLEMSAQKVMLAFLAIFSTTESEEKREFPMDSEHKTYILRLMMALGSGSANISTSVAFSFSSFTR